MEKREKSEQRSKSDSSNNCTLGLQLEFEYSDWIDFIPLASPRPCVKMGTVQVEYKSSVCTHSFSRSRQNSDERTRYQPKLSPIIESQCEENWSPENIKQIQDISPSTKTQEFTTNKLQSESY
mmetsp:Transcript_6612/g.11806  ORF Transcript_6612/g.11806 Transcript_6612/m.11806 type:complete len:123 (-) Transcript_6612:1001-1369(-)